MKNKHPYEYLSKEQLRNILDGFSLALKKVTREAINNPDNEELKDMQVFLMKEMKEVCSFF